MAAPAILCSMSEPTVTVLRGWKPTLRFSDRLRLVRLQYGEMVGRRIDQREMAQLTGIPHGSWGNWENGVSEPKNAVATAQKIVALTGVNAAWLLGLDAFDPNQGTPNVPVPSLVGGSHSTGWLTARAA